MSISTRPLLIPLIIDGMWENIILYDVTFTCCGYKVSLFDFFQYQQCNLECCMLFVNATRFNHFLLYDVSYEERLSFYIKVLDRLELYTTNNVKEMLNRNMKFRKHKNPS